MFVCLYLHVHVDVLHHGRPVSAVGRVGPMQEVQHEQVCTTFHHQQGAGAVQEGEEGFRREDGAVCEHHIARRKDGADQRWGLNEVIAWPYIVHLHI